jgi:hypothetical protein
MVDEFARAIDAYAHATFELRGDEACAHVKDLGSCDRQTWARRHGFEGAFDSDTLRKFSLGFFVEDYILEALGVRMDLTHGLRLAMWPGFDGIEGQIVGEDYEPGDHEMVGHPDGVGDACVVEIKSTEFLVDRTTYARILPTLASVQEHQRHYLLQCAAYALALAKPVGILVIVCRASGKYVVLQFDPHDYEAEVMLRMIQVFETTSAAVPMPPAEPPGWSFNKNGASWMCKYCRFYSCEKNVARHE